MRVSCRTLQPVKNEMEDTGLDNNERRDNGLTIDKDAQIQVLVSNPGGDEDTIDLGRVFHNMKLRWRVYAWVLVLCMLVGLCAPLLLYQFQKPELQQYFGSKSWYSATIDASDIDNNPGYYLNDIDQTNAATIRSIEVARDSPYLK